MGNFMKTRAIELDSKKARTVRDKDGTDEHSSCRDTLSKGTEVEMRRGSRGMREQSRLTGV